LTIRAALVATVFGVLASPAVAADRQIKPFVALALGGSTTFIENDIVVAKRHEMIGVTTVVLGDLIGLDVDVCHAPGFFTGERGLVLSSSVTTVTGNVVVTLPRRLTEYFLRPYVLGGAGLMRVRINDYFDVLPVGETLATLDVGGGATGMITNRTGVSWELRHFRSFGRDPMLSGISLGPERLSFWRASMALAIRY
jgi:hypothetical protein